VLFELLKLEQDNIKMDHRKMNFKGEISFLIITYPYGKEPSSKQWTG